MSHLSHHQINNRGGAYSPNTPAPFNFNSDYFTVSAGSSFAYSYDDTLQLQSSAYMVSDNRYGYIDHHDPRSMSSNHTALNHSRSSTTTNSNRANSVLPPRRRNYERSRFSFRPPQRTIRIPHYGRNARVLNERPSTITGRNWNHEEETIILNGNMNQEASNWIRVEETLILNGVIQENETSIVDGSADGSVGLSEEVITKYLRTRMGKRVTKASTEENEDNPDVCVVCQDNLIDEEHAIATLNCGHEYHASCIKSWLRRKNVCPLCNSTALALLMENQEQRISVST